MTKPLVSIITVCKNSERYLESCIRSVLAQSYPHIEYIIVDGASGDGTLEIIQKYADRLAFWISEPDTGMYNAINKGIRRSTGSIIAYINSDDLLKVDAVAIAVDIFEREAGIDIVYGEMDMIDGDGKMIHRYRYPKFRLPIFVAMNYSTIGQPSSFWRRTVHDKIGFFDETMRMVSDFDFYSKAGSVCNLAYVDKVLGVFRLHTSSLTGTSMSVSNKEVGEIHTRYVDSNPLLKLFRPVLGFVGDLQFKSLNYRLQLKKISKKFLRGGGMLQRVLGKVGRVFRNTAIRCKALKNGSLISWSARLDIHPGGKLLIGKRVRFMPGTIISVAEGASLAFGDGAWIGPGVVIYCADNSSVGKHCRLSHYCSLLDHDYDFRNANSFFELPKVTAPVTLGDNVWIGAGAIVLKGVSIGEGSVVGANSLIKKSIPVRTVAYNQATVTMRTIE